jgi:hypothetical protein
MRREQRSWRARWPRRSIDLGSPPVGITVGKRKGAVVFGVGDEEHPNPDRAGARLEFSL